MATHVDVLTPRTFAADRAAAIPWTLWCMALACTSAIVGAHWDISWHSSIGRDNFWTPAHIAIYLCGVFGGISSSWLIFSNTFGIGNPDRANTVTIFGLRAPLGAFLVAWGGVAMLTSAPFDDWWHNAYGLDVKIISPPHVLLIFGFLSVQVGGLVLALGEMNRATAEKRALLEKLFLYLGGLILITLTILILELTTRTLMHSARFYRVLGMFIPVVLAAMSRASGNRWAATITASVYTIFLLGFQWILPLFPAEPKLGPVYSPTTYFVPPQFPLLLIVPALACDLIWQRMKGAGAWLQSLVGGLVFLSVMVAVQWPFANFLVSDGAKNWFFGSHHFGYYVHPNSYLRRGLFWHPEEEAGFGFAMIMGQAAFLSVLTSRLGMGFGNWMRTVQR
ncbi:MAG: hypothetical protein FJW36_16275 [Acidobacteria bacterium]|nr:hypothetical protein [Acidobacteriota bacterium]